MASIDSFTPIHSKLRFAYHKMTTSMRIRQSTALTCKPLDQVRPSQKTLKWTLAAKCVQNKRSIRYACHVCMHACVDGARQFTRTIVVIMRGGGLVHYGSVRFVGSRSPKSSASTYNDDGYWCLVIQDVLINRYVSNTVLCWFTSLFPSGSWQSILPARLV